MDPALQVLEDKIKRNEEDQENNDNKEKIEIILPSGKELSKDVIDEVLEYKDATNYGKSSLKLKNERLIKLAEQNFELGVFEKPVYKKATEESDLNKESLNIGFKKRKTNTSKGILINPEESP